MLRGRGLGFLVSWFLGFLVSWLLGFRVSLFLGFRVSLIPYYQNIISCFLADIDPIFKIPKNLLDGSSGFVGPVFSTSLTVFDLQAFEISKHDIFKKRFRIFLNS